MPAVENLAGPVLRQGPQGINQDFHGACIPERAAAFGKGHRHRARRRHQQQQCEPGREPVRGARIPRGLLLHLGGLVGEEIRSARAHGRELLAVRADPAEPVSLRKGSRLRLHLERAGAQVHHRARVSRRRRPDIPAARRMLEQLTQDHRVWVSSEQSYLSRALGIHLASRDRLPGLRSSRATSSCSPPTASTSLSMPRS